MMKRLYKIGVGVFGVALMLLVGNGDVVNAYPTSKSYNVPYCYGQKRATLSVYPSSGYAHAGTYQNYSGGYVSVKVTSNGSGAYNKAAKSASVGYIKGSWWDCYHVMCGGGSTQYHYSNI